jgi:glycosyltransferase involved in cell wall biosynthesis
MPMFPCYGSPLRVGRDGIPNLAENDFSGGGFGRRWSDRAPRGLDAVGCPCDSFVQGTRTRTDGAPERPSEPYHLVVVGPAAADLDLTVIVPVFERNESLRRAIASVVSQSPTLTVIIVDDGSSPEFAAIAEEIAATSGGLVQVVHQPNRGPAAARNAGLCRATSRFVMFLDSDDELADEALLSIGRHLLGAHDAGMVCGAVRLVGSETVAMTVHPVEASGVSWTRLSELSGSFAVRTDLARAVGGYDEALCFGENSDFVLRLAEECRRRSLAIAVTDDVLSIYYPDSDERRYDAKRLEAAVHLLRRGRFDLEVQRERAKLHAIATVNAARVGRYRLSVKHGVLAALAEPRNPRHLVRLAFSLSGPLARRRWLRT